jgi:L-threonylcarbamoyladenylate synthase
MPTAISYNKLDEINISNIKDVLNSGGIIIYPTETLWALGCSSIFPKSVQKIYEIKKRESTKPILSLLATHEEVSKYAKNINFNISELLKNENTPPTLIYPDCKKELSHLANKENEIAFRVSPLSYIKDIINAIGNPLTSTSANISGQSAPTNFKSISQSILNSVDLILNFEIKLSGKPSTILKITQQGEIQYIRK